MKSRKPGRGKKDRGGIIQISWGRGRLYTYTIS